MADRLKVATMDRVASVRKRYGEIIHIADGYTFTFPDMVFLSDTGHLVIFDVQTPGGPNFQGRWDDKAFALDIDVEGVSKLQKPRFRRSEEGSSGHHAEIVPTDGERKYHVNICFKGTKIFEGLICVNFDYESTATCGIGFGFSISTD